jgi:ornithine cyclodeaminase/alanine dehydrogenase-like protein (mu-crystallin family)
LASRLVADGYDAHVSTAEDVDNALREAGNVIMAIGEGTLVESDLGTLLSLTAAGSAPTDGAVLYKTTGVGRADLVITRLKYRSLAGE